MDKQELQKLKKIYSKAFWILSLSLGGLGNLMQNVRESGGTTSGTATFLVFLNAVISFSLLYCVIMWSRLRHKIKHFDDKHENKQLVVEHKDINKINKYLVSIAIVILILIGLIWIFTKIEIRTSALFFSKRECAEIIFSRIRPDVRLGDLVLGRITSSIIGLDNLTGMSISDFENAQSANPDVRLDTIIKFPIENKNDYIQRLADSYLCPRPKFIRLK